MALMDLIEYVDERGTEMTYRIPEQGSGEFKMGSQLIVRESQWAVFFRDGKAYDVFDTGRHTLSTQNVPLLTSAITTPMWGDTPFRSEVFYVSKRVFTDLKWGTVEPILFRDAEFRMIRLRSNGIYSFQISDPKLFVVKIVGTRGIYTNMQIEDFLRGVIVGRLADLLGESLDSVLDLPRYFDELGAGLKARMKDDFAQYGLVIVDFVINAISPPEDVQKRIDERSGMEAVGGMDRYFQYKAAQAIGDLAKNQGVAGDGTSDIGTAATAGLGLGAGAGLGMMIPGMLQQAVAGGARPKIRCPNCGEDVAYGSNFCPNCGTNLAATVTCPECRATLPAASKFCPNCGHDMSIPPGGATGEIGEQPEETPATPRNEGGDEQPEG